MIQNGGRVGRGLTTEEYHCHIEAMNNLSLKLNNTKHELLREYNKLVREMEEVAFREKFNSL